MPKIPVHPKVREIIGIRTEDKKMYHNDKELKAVNISQVLQAVWIYCLYSNMTVWVPWP